MKIELLNQRIDNCEAKIDKASTLVTKYQDRISKYKKELEDFRNSEIAPKRYRDHYNLIGKDWRCYERSGTYTREEIIKDIQEYIENDIKIAQESLKYKNIELNELEKTLENYQNILKEETERQSNIEDIKPIKDFLDKFEEQVYDWCVNAISNYNKELERVAKIDKEFQDIEKSHRGFVTYADDEKTIEEHVNNMEYLITLYDNLPNWLLSCCKKTMQEVIYNYVNKRKYSFGYLRKDVESEYFYLVIDDSKLKKFLDEDKKQKYDWFIQEIVGITGKVIYSVDFLNISEKGDLNGIITGEKGKAKVLTFSAGGYNIQCFHYRTRITKLD